MGNVSTNVEKTENKWIKRGKIFGALLILTGLLISIYIVLSPTNNPLIGLGLVGLVTFTFVSLEHILLQINGILDVVNLERP